MPCVGILWSKLIFCKPGLQVYTHSLALSSDHQSYT
jgi:hypothetical protein